ncbi:MAG TPA: ferrous iron transporter B, partial [Bacteroidetes bacterium]|nr:ferrous iron transporter B [Bacteroidota bacterium]
MTSRRTLAVVGTPNVGKSTLFNALTGLRQKVGNFPGVTVEPLLGSVRTSEGAAELIDLPGVYGLDPTSEDERMTADVLRGEHPSIPRPDGLIVVLNGSAPEKCLALFSSLADLGLPTVVAVTMVDEVKARGGAFDDITLHHELGVPVVSVVGSRGIGIGDLLDAIVRPTVAQIPTPVLSPTATPTERLTWATALVQRVVSPGNHNSRSEKLDRVLLHPVLGTVIFIGVMAFFFQAIFTWSEPLMTLIENGVAELQRLVADTMDDGVVQNFVTNALLGGVGSVIVFLPQILILNVMIVVLEECGYLARAAFLIDRFMGVFGLQGRSFIPLLGSFACAIPGIMSARIIPNYRDRMATILAAPLMTCSARLPVYAL